MFIIESEGYNDGHPYPVSHHATLADAEAAYQAAQEAGGWVRLRLIHVLRDWL